MPCSSAYAWYAGVSSHAGSSVSDPEDSVESYMYDMEGDAGVDERAGGGADGLLGSLSVLLSGYVTRRELL